MLNDDKDWSKKHFGNIRGMIIKNNQKIEYVEERLITDLNSHGFNSWMEKLIKQREKLMLFN